MEGYGFYGAEQASVPARTTEYPGIRTPGDLYRALLTIWSAETCAPWMRDKWTPENPSYGQCSITSFLAQDIFGGRVCGVMLPSGGYHCYNEVDGCVFDLTSEQFGHKTLVYENDAEQFRSVHFAREEKRLRYEMLREGLRRYCSRGQQDRTDREP